MHTRAIRVVYTRITRYATHAHTTRIHTTYRVGRQVGTQVRRRERRGTYHHHAPVLRRGRQGGCEGLKPGYSQGKDTAGATQRSFGLNEALVDHAHCPASPVNTLPTLAMSVRSQVPGQRPRLQCHSSVVMLGLRAAFAGKGL